MDPELPLDPRAWLCPFSRSTADQISIARGPAAPEPVDKAAFLTAVVQGARNASLLQNGFLSYQSALDTHKPFSPTFIVNERVSVAQAVLQLHHLGSLFETLAVRAGELVDGAVPDDLKAELELARDWVASHRASLVSCHVFYKINFSLARENPNHGVPPAPQPEVPVTSFPDFVSHSPKTDETAFNDFVRQMSLDSTNTNDSVDLESVLSSRS